MKLDKIKQATNPLDVTSKFTSNNNQTAPQSVVQSYITSESAVKEVAYTRMTAVVNEELWNKIRTIAENEGCPIKDIIDIAFGMAIEKYESKNGVVQVRAKQKRNSNTNVKSKF